MPDKNNMISTPIHTTQSLCPQCMTVLPAEVFADASGIVWLTRTCPQHGEFTARLWPNENNYRKMRSLAFSAVRAKTQAIRPTNKHCPTGCGICQRHLRKPTLVEIEVTQRCNLHCPVCFMSAESDYTDVPLRRLDEFFKVIIDANGKDTAIQLTGGEPTVRSDLAQIIASAREHGFWGVELNTNGLVLAHDTNYLSELVCAGLTGVYLQFDGLTNEVYKQVRGADLLDTKLKVIENCRKQNLQVVLAMTIIAGINDDQIGDVIDFALQNIDVVTGVALQPAFTSGRFEAQRCEAITAGDVIFMLEAQCGDLIKSDDILPLGCSHPLCDMGTFLLQEDEGFVPITRELSHEEYMQLYNPDSPQGSVFNDILVNRGVCDAKGLSILIMNYMDAYNIDVERLQECSMFVTMADGSLVPFCSYQLTDCSGKRIYAPWKMPVDENGAVKWQ